MIGCAAIALVYGQRPMSPERITALRALSADLHQRHLAERRQVVRLAAAAGIPVRRVLPDGRTAELQRFVNGLPFCYITTNLNAAWTVSTNLVWPDGGMELDLTGSGITAGIWDDGGVRTTHQEFGGRVSLADGSTISSDHATHVAGTMITSGIDPAAKGMAGEASLQSYDWFDDSGEMANAAAAGLALSNHSYSYIVGWQLGYEPDRPNDWYWFGDISVSTTEDYRFGFYDTTASDWDSIAVNAPTYLIVAAAGNDRWDDGPSSDTEKYWWWNPASPKYNKWEETTLAQHPRNPDGDYDCLPGGPQVAKNALVVGAVDDIPDGYAYTTDVAMTPFSSWGPTDDGRIKPDLVANGKEVYSTLASGDAAYGPLSGTSMAAASVTGSVALLQQHYRQTHNNSLPLAATLRALLIHTADEAGTAQGPDYAFGWGLLNTAAAADLISRDAGEQWTIKELTLNNGEIHSTAVTSDGTEPLKVTIAWTDPPATPLSPALNDITARLINDLDLQITRESDGQTYYPWCLDVEHPDWAATQDDNSVDNVEQVLIPTTGPGEYIVTVSHKRALLAGVQDFSMVITGASMPQVLVWEGIQSGTDYSGIFIRDTLAVVGDVDVTYTTTFPESLSVFDAAFLSFGPSGAIPNRTPLNNTMAAVIQGYLEDGGSLYIEGGDALGEDLDITADDTLRALMGVDSVCNGNLNPLDGLEGQPDAITSGMSFSSSTQTNMEYPDIYFPGDGIPAFVESNYGTVAVQNTGSYGQRTFVFSYVLAELVDGASSPSTKSDLLAAILDFFLEEPVLVNNPPQITSPDTATATVDVLFVYRATATDPDGDPVTFTFDSLSTWLTDVGPDSVAGTPGEGVTGGRFRVIASDGQLDDTLQVTITVSSANDPPVFISTIADTSFKEDSTLSLPLSLWFQAVEDEETPDSQLIWSITGNDSVSTTFSADADSVLFAAPLNWHGEDTLSVIASDGAQADTTALIITVFPVNDAPGNFAMLTPASDFTLVITNENLGDALTFSWESADDVDGDAVRYGALVTGDLNIVLTISDTAANEVRLANADIAALLEAAGRSSGVSGTWVIFASDGEVTTWADNEPFTLTVSVVLAIDPLPVVPKEFALRQNYPNPFNPSTTLRFALPRAVEVRLVVVDLLGREIARLVDGHLPAGYHQVTWDGKTNWGKEAPSGVYIVRLLVPDALGRGAAPGFVRQVKMVLLR